MQVMTKAREHQKTVTQVTMNSLQYGQGLWSQVSPNFISASWQEMLPAMKANLSQAQFASALDGFAYTGLALAQQGQFVPSAAMLNVSSLAGYSSAGYPLDFTLMRPVTKAKQAIASGLAPGLALQQAMNTLMLILKTQIKDASRVAASVDIAAKPQIGYVRMVGPNSCGRCIVLAGRYFKWNQGFLRHPQCNCVHVPSTMSGIAAAVSEGLIQDPYEAFQNMSPEQRIKSFGAANSEAIQDGADLYQVVNARRGANGIYTTEGTTRSGYSSALKGRRLTPDAIYAQGLSREKTLDLLKQNNYLLSGGQVPGGSIRGDVQGYGAMGRGGTRVGVRSEIDRVNRTGIRTPGSRSTMTEAERRLHDSKVRYEAVLTGKNPYSRNGSGLTPALAAQVEADYKRWLATGGQVFIN